MERLEVRRSELKSFQNKSTDMRCDEWWTEGCSRYNSYYSKYEYSLWISAHQSIIDLTLDRIEHVFFEREVRKGYFQEFHWPRIMKSPISTEQVLRTSPPTIKKANMSPSGSGFAVMLVRVLFNVGVHSVTNTYTVASKNESSNPRRTMRESLCETNCLQIKDLIKILTSA